MVRRNGRGPRTYRGRGEDEPDDGREYTAEQVEFMMAMENYKRRNRVPYPDCRDVLRVLKSLGYRKEGDHA